MINDLKEHERGVSMFEDELKKALKGELYQDFGLKEDPFVINPADPAKSFVNRVKETSQFIRAFVNLKDKAIPHIAILGTHGIGKTHFLKFLEASLQESLADTSFQKIIYGSGELWFKDHFLDESAIPNFVLRDDMNKSDTLVLIDDLDIITNRYPKQASALFERLEGRLIGTWDIRAWITAKRKTDFKTPKTEAILLDRLTGSVCLQILKNRIDQMKVDDKVYDLFTEKMYSRLANLSDGNPYRLITYAKRFLNFVIDNNIKKMDSHHYEKFSDEIGFTFLEDIKKSIEGLTPKQKEILKIIIEKIEVSSDELAQTLGVSRVAGVQHLHALRDKKLLESKPKENRVKFYVPTEWADEISDILNKETTGANEMV